MTSTATTSATQRPSPRESLESLLETGEYLSYAYSYPHKTAYRPLDPVIDLREAWAREDRSALFLYVHIPFCEQRCGFCNLFTQVRPGEGLEERYVASLEQQAEVLAEVLAPARFAQLAVGGGTPTYLSAPLLGRVFRAAKKLHVDDVPTSVEVSPATFDEAKLAVLVEHGATRVSIGVQSFDESETAAVNRRQDVRRVERALHLLRDAVAVRNVDLIYGIPGQSPESLRESIDRALDLGATEIYLYPLYVRPMTVLGRRPAFRDERLALYRAGRDHLLARGWHQASMRMFESPDADASSTDQPSGPRYRCQDDGMVGLGAGARSYTRAVHYASPYAVSQPGVKSRIGEWVERPKSTHAFASHGIVLSADEQRRRYVLLSLLDRGIDRRAYRDRFAADVLSHLPELQEAVDASLVTMNADFARLTESGVERSDVLGYWLQSDSVRNARLGWSLA